MARNKSKWVTLAEEFLQTGHDAVEVDKTRLTTAPLEQQRYTMMVQLAKNEVNGVWVIVRDGKLFLVRRDLVERMNNEGVNDG